MRDNEHRTHSFIGVGEQNPTISEIRYVNGLSNPNAIRHKERPSVGSPVEDVVCFRDTVRQLGDYFSTLSDAEVLAVQARIVLPQLFPGGDLTNRTLGRLGIADERLVEIREEIKNIVFG